MINNIGQTSKIFTNGSNHQCKARLIVSIDTIGISPMINQLKIKPFLRALAIIALFIAVFRKN